jgi:integrase/recombinase XerD
VTALAPVLEAFFTTRLTALRASPHTVATYRDTYRLLLSFTQARCGKPPAELDIADLNAATITAFLQHVETDRRNAVATRNLRLAAIHSLFRYAALRCPEHAGLIQRVLAIPTKRPDIALVSFLTRTETLALLAAPDQNTWLGRRDHLLLTVATETGLRVSELTGLTVTDVAFGGGAHVRCVGKGRRERATPLTKQTARLLASWLTERNARPEDPLLPSRVGGRLVTETVADCSPSTSPPRPGSVPR